MHTFPCHRIEFAAQHFALSWRWCHKNIRILVNFQRRATWFSAISYDEVFFHPSKTLPYLARLYYCLKEAHHYVLFPSLQPVSVYLKRTFVLTILVLACRYRHLVCYFSKCFRCILCSLLMFGLTEFILCFCDGMRTMRYWVRRDVFRLGVWAESVRSLKGGL